VAAIKETPDKDAAAARLLRNQEDIGNAVVPLYGDDAGKGLTVLLKQHILIAVDLVEAGDEARFQTEDEKWSRNVEEIATFLSGANPNWPKNVKDDGGVVARRYGAVTTPHAFVLDERRRLRYRGRVADSRQASTVTVPYLELAVGDVLDGRQVAVAETEPYGCSIIW
jgi:hypothetical protein